MNLRVSIALAVTAIGSLGIVGSWVWVDSLALPLFFLGVPVFGAGLTLLAAAGRGPGGGHET